MSLQDPAALSSERAEQSNLFTLVVLYRSFPVEIFMNAWERADSCMILVVLSVPMLGLGEDALNSASNWLRILPVKGHPGCLFPGRSFIFVNYESGTTKVPAAEGHPISQKSSYWLETALHFVRLVLKLKPHQISTWLYIQGWYQAPSPSTSSFEYWRQLWSFSLFSSVFTVIINTFSYCEYSFQLSVKIYQSDINQDKLSFT